MVKNARISVRRQIKPERVHVRVDTVASVSNTSLEFKKNFMFNTIPWKHYRRRRPSRFVDGNSIRFRRILKLEMPSVTVAPPSVHEARHADGLTNRIVRTFTRTHLVFAPVS